jgi:hypothetical protein
LKALRPSLLCPQTVSAGFNWWFAEVPSGVGRGVCGISTLLLSADIGPR